jgi:hypothetical protein
MGLGGWGGQRRRSVSEFELLIIRTCRYFGCKTAYLKIVVTPTSRESHSSSSIVV